MFISYLFYVCIFSISYSTSSVSLDDVCIMNNTLYLSNHYIVNNLTQDTEWAKNKIKSKALPLKLKDKGKN